MLADKLGPHVFPDRLRGQGPVCFDIEGVLKLGNDARPDPENLPVRTAETQMPTGIGTDVSAFVPKIVLSFWDHAPLPSG